MWEAKNSQKSDRQMPEWLVGLLTKEAPTFGILLGAGWVLFRYITTQHKEHLSSLDAKQKAELDRLVNVFTKAIEDKENEIGRLVAEKESDPERS
jgi:hypothetical protein